MVEAFWHYEMAQRIGDQFVNNVARRVALILQHLDLHEYEVAMAQTAPLRDMALSDSHLGGILWLLDHRIFDVAAVSIRGYLHHQTNPRNRRVQAAPRSPVRIADWAGDGIAKHKLRHIDPLLAHLIMERPEFTVRVLSLYHAIPEHLLAAHAPLWYWAGLSASCALPWSDALIDRHADHLSWPGLSRNGKLPWNVTLIERYADRWDWSDDGLSGNWGIPWSDELLDRFRDRWDWKRLSWDLFLPWSHDIIKRFEDRWDWGPGGLSWNEALPWSEALIQRYRDRWDWNALSANGALPWSEPLISQFEDGWTWGERGLSANQEIPWSESLIARYEGRWDWRSLSSNPRLSPVTSKPARCGHFKTSHLSTFL